MSNLISMRRAEKARSVWSAGGSAPLSRTESVAGGNNGGRFAGWRNSGAKAAAVQTLARVSTGLLGMMLLLSGCVSPRSYLVAPLAGIPAQEAERIARQHLASLFPPQYRSVQRAIITVGRKQFTCDGVLVVSPGEGHHLAVVSNLGVVTELRLNADGTCDILKVTPLFQESWSRRFVARDLRWLFVPPVNLEAAGRLADGRLALESRGATGDATTTRYIFSPGGERWEELELLRDGCCFYRVEVRRYRAFAGCPAEVPSEFRVTSKSYRLELRVAELSVPASRAGASGQEAPP
jgi:hypothetical protein